MCVCTLRVFATPLAVKVDGQYTLRVTLAQTLQKDMTVWTCMQCSSMWAMIQLHLIIWKIPDETKLYSLHLIDGPWRAFIC